MATIELRPTKPFAGVLIHNGRPARRIFEESADGGTQKWIGLRNAFKSSGCELLTLDDLAGRTSDFELHLDARSVKNSIPAFAILAECKLLHPLNAETKTLKQYRGVFTWNPELVESGLAKKIQLAHPLGRGLVDGYSNRDRLVVLIAANKALPTWQPHFDLYSERVRAIRWFKRHAPNEFALYGHGWDKTARLPTRLGSAIHRLESLLPIGIGRFTSWHGILSTKREALRSAKFSIAYENVRGLRGYITEKIFDAFCAGNVPVYWGAEDITVYIPKACFIDRREFSDYGELYEFLHQMPEEVYLGYQRAIRDFLASEAAQMFSTERFAKVVISEVLAHMEER